METLSLSAFAYFACSAVELGNGSSITARDYRPRGVVIAKSTGPEPRQSQGLNRGIRQIRGNERRAQRERPASGVRSPGTPEERLPGIHTLSPFVVKKGKSKTMRQGPFCVLQRHFGSTDYLCIRPRGRAGLPHDPNFGRRALTQPG